jgi:hypothetical protein
MCNSSPRSHTVCSDLVSHLIQECRPRVRQVLAHFLQAHAGFFVHPSERAVVVRGAQSVEFGAQELEVERFHLDQQSHDAHGFVRIGAQAFSGAIVQRTDQALIAVVVVAFKTDPFEIRGPPQSGVAGSQKCFGIGLNLAQFVTDAGRDDHGWVELTANLVDLNPQGIETA